MASKRWKLALVLQMAMLLQACSFERFNSAPSPAQAQLLFEQPQGERQVLQALTSTPGVYPSLAVRLAAPSTQRAWLVGVNPSLVGADRSELAIKMPEGDVVRFNLKRASDVAGMSGWLGDVTSDRRQRFASDDEVDFDPFNWVSLVRDGNKVVGDFHVKGQLYRLEPVNAEQHVLIKVDESKMAAEGDPVLTPRTDSVSNTGNAEQSAHSTIRVLFVTTRERRTHSPHYRQELVQALQDANQYLINSRVPITYELAGFLDPDYSEGNKSQWTMLQEMTRAEDALGGAIDSERERSGADLVSLYNTESSICGNAYSWSRKETGFNTISCTVALAHELAHNLGAGHGLEGTDPTKSYNHGYRHYSPNFHTLQVTSHGAIPYFSNPRVQYQGVPIGTVMNHDVSRQLSEYRTVVENFYPHIVTYTLYEDEHYQGASCVILHRRPQSSYLPSECGGDWGWKVSSLRISGVVPGLSVQLKPNNGAGYTNIWSDQYTGELGIPTMTTAPHFPPGVRRVWGGSANDSLIMVENN